MPIWSMSRKTKSSQSHLMQRLNEDSLLTSYTVSSFSNTLFPEFAADRHHTFNALLELEQRLS
eukprot:12726940-Prorocentrum_lima.AAC.1